MSPIKSSALNITPIKSPAASVSPIKFQSHLKTSDSTEKNSSLFPQFIDSSQSHFLVKYFSSPPGNNINSSYSDSLSTSTDKISESSDKLESATSTPHRYSQIVNLAETGSSDVILPVAKIIDRNLPENEEHRLIEMGLQTNGDQILSYMPDTSRTFDFQPEDVVQPETSSSTKHDSDKEKFILDSPSVISSNLSLVEKANRKLGR